MHKATVAGFISVLALLLSVYTALVTHRQERLSALPLISFRRNATEQGVVGTYIENGGLGPLLIKSFTPASSNALAALRSDFPTVAFDSVTPGAVLRPGERLWLFHLPANDVKDGILYDQLADAIDEVFEYCSLYGNCWMACSVQDDPRCKGEHPYDMIFHPNIWQQVF